MENFINNGFNPVKSQQNMHEQLPKFLTDRNHSKIYYNTKINTEILPKLTSFHSATGL